MISVVMQRMQIRVFGIPKECLATLSDPRIRQIA